MDTCFLFTTPPTPPAPRRSLAHPGDRSGVWKGTVILQLYPPLPPVHRFGQGRPLPSSSLSHGSSFKQHRNLISSLAIRWSAPFRCTQVLVTFAPPNSSVYFAVSWLRFYLKTLNVCIYIAVVSVYFAFSSYASTWRLSFNLKLLLFLLTFFGSPSCFRRLSCPVNCV